MRLMEEEERIGDRLERNGREEKNRKREGREEEGKGRIVKEEKRGILEREGKEGKIGKGRNRRV